VSTAPKTTAKSTKHPVKPRAERVDPVESYKRLAARFPKTMAKLAE
jgi:hypothetical protein